MAQLAFFKGQGNWVDRIIRLVSRSPYSHVELIAEPMIRDQAGGFICYSSSPRDGGVRIKPIVLKDGHWDVVPVEWYAGDVRAIFRANDGARYDWIGILFSQFLNWRRQDKKRWFCSEIIATALGLPNPESFSPGSLKATVEKLNLVHRQGVMEGARRPNS